MPSQCAVVGAGVFGAAAALELAQRGHGVTLFDPGPIPHPLAASTDISKVIRIEYGPDDDFMALAEEAREGWFRWNEESLGAQASPPYHECGVLIVSRDPMAPGGFEHESWTRLVSRGYQPDRMTADTLAERFPGWSTGSHVDGFYHALGGYAESGRVVAELVERARGRGVTLVNRRVDALLEGAGRVSGVRDDAGDDHAADHVVIAAGAWSGKLLGMPDAIRSTGHPVFHLTPRDPELFRAERFPVFTADIARTGFYGFPLHPTEGVVKVARHGAGVPIDPDAPRVVPEGEYDRLRGFLADTFPALAHAEIVYSRLCLYADTQDGDFWIARAPDREGLTVASGGSGHGFKFAPVLGGMIADVVEGRDGPWMDRLRWRPEVRLAHGHEAARCHDP